MPTRSTPSAKAVVAQSSAKSIASHIIRLFNILPSFRINLSQNALPRG